MLANIVGDTVDQLAPYSMLHRLIHDVGASSRAVRVLSTEGGRVQIDTAGLDHDIHFGRLTLPPSIPSRAPMVPSVYDPEPITGSEAGKLASNIGFGGHTIKRHVGKNVEYLQSRLKKVRAASSFKNLDDANDLVKELLVTKIDEVEEWWSLAEKGISKSFDHYFPYDVGIFVARENSQLRTGRKLSVTLRKDDYNERNWFVVRTLSVIEPISARYPGIFQLGSTLGEDWEYEGNNLVECLASHCRGFSPYRRKLVNDARIWLTWDDEKLEQCTHGVILYYYENEGEPKKYPNARAFWKAVIAYVEQDLERNPS